MTAGSPESLPEESADALYDAFLARALDGEACADVEAELDAHPELGPGEREELRERLGRIRALALAGSAPSATPGRDLGRVGEFRLLERLGSGAMGEVFLAEQTSLGRHVALKLLREGLADAPAARLRIEREARALARLEHPSVVGVYGFGEERGVRWLAMELVRGGSLEERLRGGGPRPSAAEVVRWCAQLARGLAAVHRAGLLHRDVKPSNVRIAEDGRAVLVDFGLVRAGTASELSLEGEFLGSPAYAAPEQVRGDVDLDGRADVYSLGATLYRALAGRPPFAGESLEAVLHDVLTREPPPLRSLDRGLPRDLELVCARAMNRSRARRYADADELADDLEAVLALRPVSARPAGVLERALKWVRRNPLAAAAGAVAAAALVGTLLTLAVQARRDRAERVQQAAALVAEARALVASYVDERRTLKDDEQDYLELWNVQELEYLGAAQLDELARLEALVETSRARRQDAAHGALDRLERALRLDPDLQPQVRRVRAELALERLADAQARNKWALADVFAAELARNDEDGALRTETYPDARLTLAALPEDCTAWLFRYRELDALVEGGERRQVPVPWPAAGDPPHPWGAPALRVVRAADGLLPGDLVLGLAGRPIAPGPRVTGGAPRPPPAVGDRLVAIGDERARDAWDVRTLSRRPGVGISMRFETEAGELTLTADEVAALGLRLEDDRAWARRGAERARVYSRGRVFERPLPPGLELRETWAPLFPGTANRLAPGVERELEPGNYVVAASGPGRVLQRVVLSVGDELDLRLELDPPRDDFAPPGFVYVRVEPHGQGGFWVADNELTAAEYLAFLNDPETRAAIEAAWGDGRLLHVPRSVGAQGPEGLWRRLGDGSFALPDDWPADWPVIGISFEDARAYCAWRTRRAGNGRYRLPTSQEVNLAGSGAWGRTYSWGERFDPRFANTCFSRPQATPEPVRNNPRDESPFGLYDTCGNALEWTEGWYDEGRGLRHAIGGAWGQSRIADLGVNGGHGLFPTTVSGETGLRLAWDPPEAEGGR